MKPLENKRCLSAKKGLAASIIMTLLFLLVMSFLLFGRSPVTGLKNILIAATVLVYFAFLLFMMLYTGNVNRWRKIFFTSYAVFFAIGFIWWTMGDRGHMWLLDKEMLYSQAPMCHMVIPVLILPLLFMKEFIFFTPLASGLSFMFLVLAISVIYGRAFCSWGCFYGGQDELFASLPKKKRWNIRNLPRGVRYFAFGLLAFIVLHSLATLSPTYCTWFCPFKATTEFIEVNSFIRVIQTFIFVALWVMLVIFLPFITKKRMQCGTFCPMGAFLSCFDKVTLFNLKIDKGKCSQCGHCISVCPTFSMTEEAIEKGKPTITCCKCGACLTACPKQAIGYGVKGVPFTAVNHPMMVGENPPGFWKRLGADLLDPGVIFIFGIFILGTVIGFNSFTNTISRLLTFFLGV